MIEAAIAFTAGAILGASAAAITSAPAAFAQAQAPPPPPPPMPARVPRKPKTRIFYKMKELPITKDGEDTLVREQDNGFIVDPSPRTSSSGLSLAKPPKITMGDISSVVLKKAPPLLNVEEKKAIFFHPQRPIHVELLQRLHTLQPQQ